MLLVNASFSCDTCLNPFLLDEEASPRTPAVRAPFAIDCGHIFCDACIRSFAGFACPLCRSYFDPRTVRRLHINVAPQISNIRSARVGRPNNNCVTSSKEDLKDRIISFVRNGSDGSHYQALIQETDSWLEEQIPEEHWDLRALYVLIRHYQIHKDEQAATVSLLEKTKLYEDALRQAGKHQQEIAELKQTIKDLRGEMDSKEVKWTVQEKQLTTKHDGAIKEISPRKQLIGFPIIEDECSSDTQAHVKRIVTHFSPLAVRPSPIPAPATTHAVKNIGDSVDNEGHYFKSRPHPSEDRDRDQTPLEHPSPLVATPVSKRAVIGAVVSRFYAPPSETSPSWQQPTPVAYHSASRRHVKEKEKLGERSRNNSSVNLGRVPFPKSGEEAERTRCTRQQLPSHQSAPLVPIHNSPPTATPPTRRPVRISCPNVATEEIERERQRRRYQSNQYRTPEIPATQAAPSQPLPVSPPPPHEVHTQRLVQPRPSVQSLKDATKAHGAKDNMQRRPVYSERRSAGAIRIDTSDRRPSIGMPLARGSFAGSVTVKPRYELRSPLM